MGGGSLPILAAVARLILVPFELDARHAPGLERLQYFYISGREEDPSGWHGRASTGLAVLRRDGFASMDAGSQGGTLTTHPVTFNGQHLFVNIDCPQGELTAEVLDQDGQVIALFTKANCQPITTDSTLIQVTWQGVDNLSALIGKLVRFRFHLKNASLYAFWVSPDSSGASHGYVSAGGPGLTGPTDSEGIKAYP